MALAQAEEGHRLNVRALGTRKPGTSLREGLDNLEHASVSVRTLLRAVHDATRERTGIREDAAYAEEVRLTTSVLMGAVAAVVRGYGLLVRRGVESRGAPESPELHDALDALRTHRGEVTDLLLMDPRGRDVLWGLTAALLTTVDRVLLEIDAVPGPRERSRAAPGPSHERHLRPDLTSESADRGRSTGSAGRASQEVEDGREEGADAQGRVRQGHLDVLQHPGRGRAAGEARSGPLRLMGRVRCGRPLVRVRDAGRGDGQCPGSEDGGDGPGGDPVHGGSPSVVVGQQIESAGLGLVSPNSGRSRSPTQVPPRASTAQIQPCRLNEAMPEK
jgi:hypothetical protein